MTPTAAHPRPRLALAMVVLAAGCAEPSAEVAVRSGAVADGGSARSARSTGTSRNCEPGDAGIALPPGFCATVFADGLGRARHLAIREDGAVFVMLRPGRGDRGGMVALRDADGDGVADQRADIPVPGGSGIALRGEWVYFAPNDGVRRARVPAGALEPVGEPETIVSGLPSRGHAAKTIALHAGSVYVNIGSVTDACEVDRRRRSPGRDPCTELRTNSGVWRFDADVPGQAQADGEHFATGIRNLVAITIGPDGALYGVQQGRDRLADWGYSAEANAEKPAEELFRIEAGDDFGWPYCYYDRQLGRKVLAPEYGGDGEEVGRCASKKDPLMGFPGHWAPDGIAFYEADAFPSRYRGGAFIAFHGSWNRAPLPQAGYNVVFVPFEGGEPTGEWEVFADGFAGEDVSPRGADHRPTGVSVGPEGALYVSDDAGGRVWRITYVGT